MERNAQHGLRINVMGLSSVAQEQGPTVLRALEIGAVSQRVPNGVEELHGSLHSRQAALHGADRPSDRENANLDQAFPTLPRGLAHRRQGL